MFRSKLFRTPKPLQFRYIPRYYDPEKEDLEKRVKAAEQGVRALKDQMKSQIENSYKYRFRQKRLTSRRAIRRSNYRVFIILLLLIAFCYILFVNFFPLIESSIE